jgi:hypothetical protein
MDFHIQVNKIILNQPGLMATEKILSDEELVKVPVHLLFTTRDAYFSEIRQVYTDHPLFFSHIHTSSWEDRMQLVYLLFEFQKGRESRFYHLITNLPREIDYLVF